MASLRDVDLPFHTMTPRQPPLERELLLADAVKTNIYYRRETWLFAC
jgi:hypothetical protein